MTEVMWYDASIMTTKQKVEAVAKSWGISIEREVPKRSWRGVDPIGELVAPDGKGFADGDGVLHAITFASWDEALDTLTGYKLIPCAEDCDCRE